MKNFIMNQITIEGPEEERTLFNEEIQKYNIEKQSETAFKFNTRNPRVEEYVLNQSQKLPNSIFGIKVFDIENGWAGESKIQQKKVISSYWVAWHDKEEFVKYITNNQDAFGGSDLLFSKLDLSNEPYITLDVNPNGTAELER